MNKLRLKWKIFSFLLGFCGLLLLILWLFQTVFLDTFYRNIKVMELKNSTASVAQNIEEENVSEILEHLLQNKEIFVEVLAVDGSTVFTTAAPVNSLLYRMPSSEKLALIQEAQTQKGELYRYTTDQPHSNPITTPNIKWDAPGKGKFPMQSLIYVKLVTNSNGDLVAILSSSMIAPVNATVMTIQYQLYAVTAIMIVLSIILALILARYVSRPIETISKSAGRLAAGDYTVTFNGTGYHEILQLSEILNHTARELSKVETLRRELMANVSHDLRTPLSLIYSYAEMMQDFPQEITHAQIQVIMDETTRLTTLVNDILDISRLESGMEELHKTRFNLTARIKEINARCEKLIIGSGFNICFEYDDEVFVFADETKMMQVYYNLLLNAINHTGKDKRIEVIQISDIDTVEIAIKDSGDGITEETLPYIWDRYYKVDKNHRRAVTGTGLGLSIVKKIMEQHGGEYGVWSEVEKGSTFWIVIDIDHTVDMT